MRLPGSNLDPGGVDFATATLDLVDIISLTLHAPYFDT